MIVIRITGVRIAQQGTVMVTPYFKRRRPAPGRPRGTRTTPNVRVRAIRSSYAGALAIMRRLRVCSRSIIRMAFRTSLLASVRCW